MAVRQRLRGVDAGHMRNRGGKRTRAPPPENGRRRAGSMLSTATRIGGLHGKSTHES